MLFPFHRMIINLVRKSISGLQRSNLNFQHCTTPTGVLFFIFLIISHIVVIHMWNILIIL